MSGGKKLLSCSKFALSLTQTQANTHANIHSCTNSRIHTHTNVSSFVCLLISDKGNLDFGFFKKRTLCHVDGRQRATLCLLFAQIIEYMHCIIKANIRHSIPYASFTLWLFIY